MNLAELLGAELYAQVEEKINAANANQPDKKKHIRFVDLSEGGYVGKANHDNTVATLNDQITELTRQINDRAADITDLQSKLAAAQTDASKLAEAQTAVDTLKAQYDTDKAAWDQALKDQARDFKVREKASTLKFSSAAAQRDFMRAANDMNFKLDGETVFGYDDFVTKYKADNPGAVIEETSPPADPATPPPQIVAPAGSPPPVKKKSLSEMMAAKNANPNLEISFN